MSSLQTSTDSRAVTGQNHRNSAEYRQPKAGANTSSLRARTYNPSSLEVQSLNLLLDSLDLHSNTVRADIPYSGPPTTPVPPPKADTGESAGNKEPILTFDFRVALELGRLQALAEEHNRKQDQLLLKQDGLMHKQEGHETLIWRALTMLKNITEEIGVIKRALCLLQPELANALYVPKTSQAPPQRPQ
ncbi:hypothetical protein TWF102_006960 [Orbilia oligospora]|uniref:Uncharacterized protein n=1 Tax=Orbilia oligospora TaxID=2813651 RepID=A0A7C8JCN2_ORBOL|nr:hypothetical protein TWF103_005833 [Orbilia oligospora]KAF3111287.1 hypothetical protein TWF102_006960 [Orbilia oligospora]